MTNAEREPNIVAGSDSNWNEGDAHVSATEELSSNSSASNNWIILLAAAAENESALPIFRSDNKDPASKQLQRQEKPKAVLAGKTFAMKVSALSTVSPIQSC